ncbi:hypothetical protein [Saccharomonospora xinjiangensis]|uniref:Uncharacterized protein n=1 Tax=Saccharomonospora xinjiangensis XJ-54 TaxID=882086 RepID=I0V8X8_9PSEU|nr:hypothetical protein [Saccharomonospora xinjiangensis]EID56581.1 hypothetical protein SacxiDRAFT_4402 [Saccharomonospora xinjiangensis XJ-54]
MGTALAGESFSRRYPLRGQAIRVLILACLSAAVVVGTGGCGADLPRESGDRANAATSPLDDYLPTPEADRVTAVARDLLARQCLNRYGLGQDRPMLPVDGGLVTRLRERAQAVEVPVELARRHGFHPPEQGMARADASGGTRPDSARLWADRVAVLNGWRIQEDNGGPVLRSRNGVAVPEDGCVGEADERLSDGLDRPVEGTAPGAELDAINTVLALRKTAGDLAAQDPVMIEATRRWADCFETATGTDAPNPFAVVNDPRWAGPPTEEEIETAVALATCRDEVDYLGTRLSLLSQYESEVLAQHQNELDRVRQFFDERYQRAREVVSSSRQ